MALLRLRRESRQRSVTHFSGNTLRIIVMPPFQRGTQLARLPIAQQPDAAVAARHAVFEQRERRSGVAPAGAVVELDGVGTRHEWLLSRRINAAPAGHRSSPNRAASA
ncbi:conserved hypothetical protein [Paraburkholderia tropica]|uniref:hypothetical protein n=1 Tax=Paraburkholderia tropica TaxID=92647 RepID=UPI001CAD5DF3|nr:conserved hypothetical protein [Paraburkholderia tropica]